MQLVKNLNKRFNSYVESNKEKLLDDFCVEIKEFEIANMTLDDYAKFRFWKHDQKEALKFFYKDFKKNTKDKGLDFDLFCRLTWEYMDEGIGDLPDEIKAMANELNNIERAEA